MKLFRKCYTVTLYSLLVLLCCFRPGELHAQNECATVDNREQVIQTTRDSSGIQHQVQCQNLDTGKISAPFSSVYISLGNTTSNINNTLYISQFAGADLGAKMNAAVTQCTVTLGLSACKYIIDIGGTISTAPNFPIGSIVECVNGTGSGPASITLATTWNIQHRNTTYNFNGCQFYYNQDAGQSAIVVGKPNVGTVNTVGTGPSTVTYVSGSTFTNIDVCDFIIINGVLYNVASVTPPNTLTVAGNTGTQTGVAYAGVVNSPTCGNYLGGVTVRDLNLTYSGAGTTSSVGVQLFRAYGTDLENVHVRDFTGLQSQGFLTNGALYTSIYKLWLYNNKCQAIIDQSTAGGLTVTSNSNKFILPVVQAGGACGSGVAFDVRAGANNTLDAPDVESNVATKAVQFNGIGDIVRDGFFQLNGDGTGSSADIAFIGGRGNVAENNKFASLSSNVPNSGIICTGSTTSCDVRNNIWDPVNNHYGNAITFSSSATGTLEGNDAGTTAVVTPPLYGSQRLSDNVSSISPNTDAPLKVFGNSDSTGLVAVEINSKVTNIGSYIHWTAPGTFDACSGVEGTTGDFLFRDGCFPGTAGTERFRIKRTNGQVSANGGSVGNIAITLNGVSASLGGSLLAAGACSSNTTTVTGATTSMVAIADPNTYPGDGAYWDATVTSANTVTTKVCAVVSLTPTSSTYNIRVFQ